MLQDYTKEELQKKLKKQKTMLKIQTGLVFLMIIVAIFSTIEEGMTYLTFLPLFFIPMVFVMNTELKKIKKELDKRN